MSERDTGEEKPLPKTFTRDELLRGGKILGYIASADYFLWQLDVIGMVRNPKRKRQSIEEVIGEKFETQGSATRAWADYIGMGVGVISQLMTDPKPANPILVPKLPEPDPNHQVAPANVNELTIRQAQEESINEHIQKEWRRFRRSVALDAGFSIAWLALNGFGHYLPANILYFGYIAVAPHFIEPLRRIKELNALKIQEVDKEEIQQTAA
jgi:hypothetical protein